MDNQIINLSNFSPVSVNLEILLTIKSYSFITFLKISEDFRVKRHVNHELKGGRSTITLNGLLLAEKV